ncbi:membrane steroid-binding protein 2-like [Cucurbita maxima]|uniref:Membrane steroid-binding protein 2-like n=1 Tax=Cucurbita maxima TaxID=3661 RepID=A0A6J1I932_CUCMA|nr:membrane steroid-binding protein 2-like [Cucurbita maxima]
MEIFWRAMEQINWYTGLSPTAFFTILASMIFVFQMVSSMFVSPEEFNKPPTVPVSSSNSANSNLFVNDTVADASQSVQVGRLTEQQLRAYDGSDPNKPLLMAIKGQIYDVSSGRTFYGPGSPYSMFVGKDASRALALLSFKPEDINGNLEGLNEEELVILQDWEYKFMEKYVKVGELVSEEALNERSENGHQSTDTNREEEPNKDQ